MFAGFVSSVALVLAIVICSIAVYRRTRYRQQRHLATTAGTVVTGRKRAKHDSTDPPRRTPPPACRDVMRMTAVEDVRNNCNNGNGEQLNLKSDDAPNV